MDLENYRFIIDAILFYLVFKIGQISAIRNASIAKIEQNRTSVKLVKMPSTITVEEINGIYYAYDGNDFLAQGASPEELGSAIAQRYPNKYAGSRIKIHAKA